MKRRPYQKSRVDAKVWDGIQVGYAHRDAYRAYIAELGHVFVSKNVTFIEKLYRHLNTVSLDMDDNADDESNIDDVRQKNHGVADNGDDTRDEVVEQHEKDDDVYGKPHGNSKQQSWISGEHDDADRNVRDANHLTLILVQSAKQGRRKRNSNPPSRYSDFASCIFLTTEDMTEM